MQDAQVSQPICTAIRQVRQCDTLITVTVNNVPKCIFIHKQGASVPHIPTAMSTSRFTCHTRKQTAIDQGHIDRISLTRDLYVDLRP